MIKQRLLTSTVHVDRWKQEFINPDQYMQLADCRWVRTTRSISWITASLRHQIMPRSPQRPVYSDTEISLVIARRSMVRKHLTDSFITRLVNSLYMHTEPLLYKMLGFFLMERLRCVCLMNVLSIVTGNGLIVYDHNKCKPRYRAFQ